MGIANSSMLDEGTAAAEAMTLIQRVGKSASNVFYVADDVLPQTLEVIADARRSRSALKCAPSPPPTSSRWTKPASACCCNTRA